MKSAHCSGMAFVQASRCLRSRALSSCPDREFSWLVSLRKIWTARIHPGRTFGSGPPATKAFLFAWDRGQGQVENGMRPPQ